MNKPSILIAAALLGAALITCGYGSVPSTAPAGDPVKIRMSVDEDPIVMQLASALGYFQQEGVEIDLVKVEDLTGEDYLLQGPLVKGQIDAAYHWFNHAVFGARHNLLITGVMVFNDSPGMTVMVANRMKGEIKSAADFKGRNIAQGAGYGTKSVLTNYLAMKAGLPPHSYNPVFMQVKGRQEAVIQGLKDGEVDVATFQEPITSALMETNLVTTLYDLNSEEGTKKALGAVWPAQSLLMAPQYIAAHPDTVQRLVNAFVRTMRFINSHSPDEIIAKLPPEFFDKKDRQAEIKYIRKTLSTLAKGDYSFSPASVNLVVDTVVTSDFDNSEEGRWRAGVENPHIKVDQLYDNRFVAKAMAQIK